MSSFIESNEKFFREITVFFMAIAGLYSCVMSSFLAVFVPQRCDVPRNNVTRLSTDCTFEENVYIDISPYNLGTLLVNLVTCVMLAIGFFIEWRRDLFVIDNFDVDEGKPDTGLKGQLAEPANHKLLKILQSYNRTYRNYFLGLIFVFAGNVVTSGVLVFYYYYQDYRTATTFLTSIALVSQRLYASTCVAWESASHDSAESFSLSEPLFFNIVRTEIQRTADNDGGTPLGHSRRRKVINDTRWNSKTNTLSLFAPNNSGQFYAPPVPLPARAQLTRRIDHERQQYVERGTAV